MSNIKTVILLVMIKISLSVVSVFAIGEGWGHDLEGAKKEAASAGKDILIEFTGSDWCPPCMALAETITGKESFIRDASEDFVLVALDYPRKTEQEAALKARNGKLAQEYKIQGFPTLLLCDAGGRPYAKSGFQKGSPATYLALLGELKKFKTKRDIGMKKADSLNGLAKAQALHDVWQGLPPQVAALYYQDLRGEIMALDTEDVTGMKKEEETVKKIQSFMQEVGAQMKEEMSTEEAATLAKRVDEFLKTDGLSKSHQQQMSMVKVEGFYRAKQKAAALSALDAAVAIDPDSKISQQVPTLKADLVKRLDAAKLEGAAE